MDMGNLSPLPPTATPLQGEGEVKPNRLAWEQMFVEKYHFSDQEVQAFIKSVMMSTMSAMNKMMRKSREKIKKMKQERGS